MCVCVINFTLAVVVAEATQKQPSASAAHWVSDARYLTVVAWCTHPFVYIIKDVCLAGLVATTYEVVSYSIAHIFPKAVFRVLIWAIVAERSHIEEERRLLR